ncbi:MAG: YitT family protein [Clostridioides sp.]|jgi:uncharacterized membrane-anchored protein YitT (DUF2179 family)|nr:YitT family protein [Clostridioides sp.]
MSEVKDVLQERQWLRYSFMLLGMFISSIGVNGFLRPAHLLSGGVTGIATSINFLTNVNVGLLTFILNIPIFVLGFMYLEREFCILSLLNMVILSLMLGFTQEIGNIIPLDDVLLQSVFGGILSGIGVGMCIKSKSSQGGTDIIAAILKIKKNIEMKDTGLVINAVVVLVSSLIFGLQIALYTLIGLYFNATMMDIVKDMMNSQKSVMIISQENEKIAEEIMDTIVRGVTFLNAEGAYTRENKKMIYTVVSSSEIPKIKKIAFKHDSKAFISVNDVAEVKGRGFKAKDL